MIYNVLFLDIFGHNIEKTMRLEYAIDKNDYLIHQLFLASKSERVKKKRQRSKTIFLILFLLLSFLWAMKTQYVIASILAITGILWFFLYPIWERRYYINHYNAFINENYIGIEGKKATIELNNEYIVFKDESSEGRIMTKKIEEIYEIPSHIFIRLNKAQSIILPKERIENILALIKQLKEITSSAKIRYICDENWQWK